jgi:hypothetical protein
MADKPPKKYVTWRDHVRSFWPEATDDECSEILWGHTSWPFAGPAELITQLEDYMQTQGRKRQSDPYD